MLNGKYFSYLNADEVRRMVDFGDATSERGADYTHYRKHFLGTLMGTLEDNWLGYEN